MLIKVLKSKLHRAAVTQTSLDYVGSITIDADLVAAAGMREGEEVLVANLNNGNRHITYVQAGEPGSKVICLNGAGARLACVGDRVIIMAFGYYHCDEKIPDPKVVMLDEKNQVRR